MCHVVSELTAAGRSIHRPHPRRRSADRRDLYNMYHNNNKHDKNNDNDTANKSDDDSHNDTNDE